VIPLAEKRQESARGQGFPKPAKPAKKVASKIKGLADLQKSDDDSEEDESNEYYTGGEKSGMVRIRIQLISMDSALRMYSSAGLLLALSLI
jgi:hypothetical protein